MYVVIGCVAVFLIIFGALALTSGRRGPLGGEGVSFRQMVLNSPRLLKIESDRARGRSATAIVLATNAVFSAIMTGLLALVFLLTR